VGFWRKIVIVSTAVCILPLYPRVVDAVSPIGVYVFAGQSNMVGASAKTAELPAYAPSLTIPMDNILFWGPTADSPRGWAALEPPTEIWQSMVRSGFGPELSAARKLSALHGGADIAIFKYAKNSTNLYHQWNPDNPVGYYRALLLRLAYARKQLTRKTGRPTYVAGFFWMQGETDAAKYAAAYTYDENLRSLIASARRDMRNPKLPVVVGRILDVRRWTKTMRFSRLVRLRQYEVAREDPHTHLVYTDDLGREPVSPVHFDTLGTVRLGYRMVDRAWGL